METATPAGAALQHLARPLQRGGRQAVMLPDADLTAWSAQYGLSPRQAHLTALRAGILPECYERNFPTLTVGGQLRLLTSAVLVAGLGGLGGFQAMLLARLGVGRLLLADGDVFAPSNLNRQLFAAPDTLGEPKATLTAAALRRVHPALIAEPVAAMLTRENLPDLLSRVDLALDGLDTFPPRRELARAASESGRPWVHGAVWGGFGQVTTFLSGDGDRFDRLLPAEGASREPPGAVAPIVTLVASLQVQEAVRLLLGHPPVYRGRLAHFDGDTGQLEIVPL